MLQAILHGKAGRIEQDEESISGVTRSNEARIC